MNEWSKLTAAAAGSLALAVVSPAESLNVVVGPPTLVILERDGGFVRHHELVWFTTTDVAQRDGSLPGRPGERFRARVPFTRVARIVTDGDLCGRTPETPFPAGNDIPMYRLSIRCGTVWTSFTSYGAIERTGERHVRSAVIALDQLASALAWDPETADIPPPDVPASGLVRPHPATSSTP